MKTRLICSLAILFTVSCSHQSTAQNAYYDAIKLMQCIDPKTGKFIAIQPIDNDALKNEKKLVIAKYLGILRSYTTLAETATPREIYSEYDNPNDDIRSNPFIKPLLPGTGLASSMFSEINGNEISKNAKLAATGVMASIGGLDVTNIANAVADLMITRAKEELTISFFNKLKNYSERYPEFQILFPKTSDNLINLLTHTYPQMLPILRNGFIGDLNMLIYHLEDVFSLPKYKPMLAEFPEVKVFVGILGALREIEKKENVADIINLVAALPAWQITTSSNSFKNAATAVTLANIFSQSLQADSTTSKTIWISDQGIMELIDDDISFKLYLGLIYQQIKNNGLKFYAKSGANDVVNVMHNNADTIFLIQRKLKDFAIISSNVEKTVREIKTKQSKKEKITNDDYYNYINTSLDAFDFILGIVKVFHSRLTPDNYLSAARKSNTIYKNIYSKNYAAAIVDLVDLFDEMENILRQENIRKSKLATYRKPPEFEELCTYLKKVRPFAVFIANVADAKSSDDVQDVLENVILPAGSSSIKKHTIINMSIQSYLGAYWNTTTEAGNISNAWGNKFGVTAPIGLSLTPGFLSWGKGGSLSLFTPLIDLGAIVDYKLKADSVVDNNGQNQLVVSKDYKVELGHIFSPGVFAVYGFGANLPLALGFGGQYGPGLSKIDDSAGTIVNNPSWRFNVFFTVDLPFFNIVNKTKYKR